MHLLKRRQQLILGYLLTREVPVTIKGIAEQLQVSPRTVRYDLDDLGYWMNGKDLTLKKVPKKGIWIPDKQAVRAVLDKEDSVDEVKAYRILSKEERQWELLAILFAANERATVGTLAEAIGVSKSTCYGDLARVRVWLESRDMILDSAPHTGYKIFATETAWRQGLIDYLAHDTDNEQLMKLLTMNKYRNNEDHRLAFLKNPEYHEMFAEVDLDRVVIFLEALEERLEMRLVDTAYMALMIHLAIAVKRLREGEVIEMPALQLEELRVFETYGIVADVLSSMNFLRFEKVPEAEVGYITAHIVAARMRGRKASYRQLENEGLTLKGRDKQLFQGILDIVSEYASIQDGDRLKAELQSLIIHQSSSSEA